MLLWFIICIYRERAREYVALFRLDLTFSLDALLSSSQTINHLKTTVSVVSLVLYLLRPTVSFKFGKPFIFFFRLTCSLNSSGYKSTIV